MASEVSLSSTSSARPNSAPFKFIQTCGTFLRSLLFRRTRDRVLNINTSGVHGLKTHLNLTFLIRIISVACKSTIESRDGGVCSSSVCIATCQCVESEIKSLLLPSSVAARMSTFRLQVSRSWRPLAYRGRFHVSARRLFATAPQAISRDPMTGELTSLPDIEVFLLPYRYHLSILTV